VSHLIINRNKSELLIINKSINGEAVRRFEHADMPHVFLTITHHVRDLLARDATKFPVLGTPRRGLALLANLGSAPIGGSLMAWQARRNAHHYGP